MEALYHLIKSKTQSIRNAIYAVLQKYQDRHDKIPTQTLQNAQKES